MKWICRNCAALRGSFIPPSKEVLWQEGRCDVCSKLTAVTLPREYYPRADSRYD